MRNFRNLRVLLPVAMGVAGIVISAQLLFAQPSYNEMTNTPHQVFVLTQGGQAANISDVRIVNSSIEGQGRSATILVSKEKLKMLAEAKVTVLSHKTSSHPDFDFEVVVGDVLGAVFFDPDAKVNRQVEQVALEEAGDGPHSVRKKFERARADMRSLATALESYYVDTNSYAVWVPGTAENSAGRGNSLLAEMTTFHLLEPDTQYSGGRDAMTITTPIAYLTRLPADPFNNAPGGVIEAPFAYYKWEAPAQRMAGRDYWQGWIVLSPGPDGDFDINPLTVTYPENYREVKKALLPYEYDPTNGTESNGDLFRLKQ